MISWIDQLSVILKQPYNIAVVAFVAFVSLL